ncbi:hypothetical protein ALP26_103668 [Pseudomonas savastanoi pv. glycinea]|uniref:Uncharacterized protein n=15 Tax=Pseudomonas syringae group TaxID=136849 RepID=A0A0Q0H1U9_PSEAJ|nr:hypothetical protein ALO90_102983 [Pseudomonas amygdali pv. aesculi]KPW37778.1 hypothetical protein ALO51_102681 [Pseudomonas amygdali]KPW65345.1 hypothetical protein ALO78_102486 [Pseudomonas amygdali pv. ciccaronei]KPW98554.1 hypothetical protein ALO50_103268 [Pseudomonas syringae pv. cerasicola]KPW99224.1 hypothetical protein ALO79_100826 [Pseudomonas syringae pv. castaneae]KPX16921.1 hypothetical protein ALO73_103024 [Pseudomonas syringae pv. daphniphylli]KPX35461.1 hypothetical protei
MIISIRSERARLVTQTRYLLPLNRRPRPGKMPDIFFTSLFRTPP